ncbi:hypothetical protein SODALDRAFT_378167 [Sodiomyces alkalinus F11]|uniref:Uncharacterized protein n=1 Tax=Sodiomyces alkalinus (strain CBS 110278 / VKM F-3762 / F11) TaxID=1314773 RepID=A0A3N2PX97_SODAK|nr:hypothetical protein SODALDRAFT_378167 [Sodiomyces alkalinus F11]ROT39046.1 hypothetical protein SODALDRAFT_378167 [Sodiomyces alkalinus F11]
MSLPCDIVTEGEVKDGSQRTCLPRGLCYGLCRNVDGRTQLYLPMDAVSAESQPANYDFLKALYSPPTADNQQIIHGFTYPPSSTCPTRKTNEQFLVKYPLSYTPLALSCCLLVGWVSVSRRLGQSSALSLELPCSHRKDDQLAKRNAKNNSLPPRKRCRFLALALSPSTSMALYQSAVEPSEQRDKT